MFAIFKAEVKKQNILKECIQTLSSVCGGIRKIIVLSMATEVVHLLYYSGSQLVWCQDLYQSKKASDDPNKNRKQNLVYE